MKRRRVKTLILAFILLFGCYVRPVNIYYASSAAPTLNNNCATGAILGDLNGDQVVDEADLELLIQAYNSTDTYADMNQDGVVDLFDLSLLSVNVGNTPILYSVNPITTSGNIHQEFTFTVVVDQWADEIDLLDNGITYPSDIPEVANKYENDAAQIKTVSVIDGKRTLEYVKCIHEAGTGTRQLTFRAARGGRLSSTITVTVNVTQLIAGTDSIIRYTPNADLLEAVIDIGTPTDTQPFLLIKEAGTGLVLYNGAATLMTYENPEAPAEWQLHRYYNCWTAKDILPANKTYTASIIVDTSSYENYSFTVSGNEVVYTKYPTTFDSALNIQMTKSPQIYNNGWVNASRSETGQYLNPNNYYSGSYRYQFLDLSSSNGIPVDTLKSYLAGKGILSGKESVFKESADTYGVSEVYLVAHACLETGNGTSELANGVVYNGVTVYNMYGINAVDSDPVGQGAKKAYEMGWTTPELAISGGAAWISNAYINNASYKQNTLYKMRWNPGSPGSHQYATDVKWAVSQASPIKKMFDQFSDASLKFDVPSYSDLDGPQLSLAVNPEDESFENVEPFKWVDIYAND